jgi:Uri superfamily endonuclease
MRASTTVLLAISISLNFHPRSSLALLLEKSCLDIGFVFAPCEQEDTNNFLKKILGMERGAYTLVLRLDADLEACVGSLDRLSFSRGYYSYTGSALGKGGFKRVQRHLQIMQGKKATRRWHIDWLLPFTCLEEAILTFASERLECQIAGRIGARLEPIPGFGCTDCRCPSHLHYSSSREEMLSVVRDAHNAYGAINYYRPQ